MDMSEKENRQFEDTLKDAAEDVKVPESLEPKAIEKMLEKKNAEKKKKQRWKYRGAAAAAACVCLAVGVAAGTGIFSGKTTGKDTVADTGKEKGEPSGQTGSEEQEAGQIAFAKDYEEIYACIEAQNKEWNKESNDTTESSVKYEGRAMEEIAESADTGGKTASGVENGSYSETNVREDGVGEADRVKTDGKNLYILSANKVKIVGITESEMNPSAEIELPEDCYISELYIEDDRLAVMYTRTEYEDGEDGIGATWKDYTCADVYDVSDAKNPKKTGTVSQSGYYNTMRAKDGYVYMLSEFYADMAAARNDVTAYVPSVQEKTVAAKDIYLPENKMGSSYTVISSFKLDDPENKIDSKAVFGDTGICYVSQENIYIAETWYGIYEGETDETSIRKVSYSEGKLEGTAQTKIKGYLNDSFAIDEYKGKLRIVATVTELQKDDTFGMPFVEVESEEATGMTNSLYVLDEKLQIIGEISDLAPDERVYSSRFMGDIGYFVTFRQVDPLFSVDLSDPKNPKILGELKIPGFSEYLHPYGDGMLLGIGMNVDEEGVTTDGVKLSMFDISNPADVKEMINYVIKDTYSTDVAYNYKAAFIDVEKNLFGFTAYGDKTDYCIFRYDAESGFEEVFRRNLSGSYDARGLYVGDTFYLITGSTIESFTMDGFEKIDDMVL